MSSPANRRSAEERAQAIVEDVIARRRRGEAAPDDAVLREHPDLLGILERMLRAAAVVERARSESQPDDSPMERLLDHLDFNPKIEDPSAEAPVDTNDPPIEDSDPERITIDDEAVIEKIGPTIPDPTPDAGGPAGGATLVAEGPFSFGPRPGTEQTSAVARFRPSARPPMALLRVFDDNQKAGEVVRIRSPDFRIGRQGGDLTVPHDSLISGEHACIERTSEETGWVWRLIDLNSTNGVYVRARRVRLRDGDRLLIGSRTVRFRQEQNGSDPGALGPARLEEITSDRTGDRLPLAGADCWIGRDSSVCAPFLMTDPMLDAKFARLLRREDGRWTIWSSDSENGLWVRVDSTKLVDGSHFQLGEQRFSFHLV